MLCRVRPRLSVMSVEVGITVAAPSQQSAEACVHSLQTLMGYA